MRKTLSSWRCVSTSPMKTVQSRPKSAAAVADGDAVLARPGLGDHARLAHPLGQEGLPHHVVELVRARMRQVLPFEEDADAQALREARALGHRCGAARRNGGAARRARPGTPGRPRRRRTTSPVPGRPASSDSGTKRPPNSPKRPSAPGSAHEAVALARSRVPPVVGLLGDGGPRGGPRAATAASARRALAMKSRRSSGSFRPGAASTPLATSTPPGRRWATASATLSGRRPPETISRVGSVTPSARRQSNTSPEPGFSPSTRR